MCPRLPGPSSNREKVRLKIKKISSLLERNCPAGLFVGPVLFHSDFCVYYVHPISVFQGIELIWTTVIFIPIDIFVTKNTRIQKLKKNAVNDGSAPVRGYAF